MSIKNLLNSLSTTLRANDNKSLYPLLSLTEFSGLNPNSSGMTLENMINAILAYLERYNIILRHKLHSSDNDIDTILEINYDIPYNSKNKTDGAIGLFAFEDRLTTLSCTELTTIPPYFCFGSQTLESLNFPKATIAYAGAFANVRNLKSINLPLLTEINRSNRYYYIPADIDAPFYSAYELINVSLPKLKYKKCSGLFKDCSKLQSVDLPEFTGKGYSTDTNGNSSYSFHYCRALVDVNVPKLEYVGAYCFNTCEKLVKLELPSVIKIETNAFGNCSSLIALIINKTIPPTLDNIDAFTNTPIQKGTGYIYVPDSAVNTYKTATNWSSFANLIKPISEYTEV